MYTVHSSSVPLLWRFPQRIAVHLYSIDECIDGYSFIGRLERRENGQARFYPSVLRGGTQGLRVFETLEPFSIDWEGSRKVQ